MPRSRARSWRARGLARMSTDSRPVPAVPDGALAIALGARGRLQPRRQRRPLRTARACCSTATTSRQLAELELFYPQVNGTELLRERIARDLLAAAAHRRDPRDGRRGGGQCARLPDAARAGRPRDGDRAGLPAGARDRREPRLRGRRRAARRPRTAGSSTSTRCARASGRRRSSLCCRRTRTIRPARS